MTPEILNALKIHALGEYPKECCGLIVDGVYRPCFNYAIDPTQDFVIASQDYIKWSVQGTLQGVAHSHPDRPCYPTEHDMRQQIVTDLPWVIVATDGERVSDPIMWGDALPTPPLIGREFVHGVTDCYSLIRDAYRLGRLALAEQGIDWPLDPIELPEFPRRDGWWVKNSNEAPDDHYMIGFPKAGFFEIAREEVRPGDVFLKAIKSDRPNHGGVLLDGGLILHHLPQRLSRREPAGMWGRAADLWLRHEAAR